MSEAKKIVFHRSFRDPVFYENREKMIVFLKEINQLPINKQLFKIIRILIKFFRFPVLILLKPIYNRIELEKKYLEEHHEDLKRVAGFVKEMVKNVKNRKHPSLQFYYKAGYNIGQIQFNDDSGQSLMNFLDRIEDRMQNCIGLQNLQQRKKLISVQEQLEKAIGNTKSVIEIMCLETYLREVKNRRLQIQNQIKLQIGPLEKYQRAKGRRIKIQGPQEKEINDEQAANDFLCCRSYFYENEIIDEPETLVQQYKNYQYPFDAYISEILLKTICGFLNCKGGIIYIGIRERNDTKKRTVVGQRYSENAKQDLLKYFRLLCERKIYPEMISCQFYKIQFVPLKDPFRSDWIAGKFVVRMRVQKGDRKELYTFQKNNKEEMFAFRTQNQVLSHRMGQNILDIYRKRLTNSDHQQDWLNHPGPCRPVEMGKQLCVVDKSIDRIDLPWNKKQRSGISKQSSNRNLEKYKPIYICEEKDLSSSLKNFSWRGGKTSKGNFVYFEVSSVREMDEFDSILIQSKNVKIRKISKKIRFKNITLNNLQQLLKNSLYSVIGDDTLVMNSIEEVIFAEEIMSRARVQYQFLFDIY